MTTAVTMRPVSTLMAATTAYVSKERSEEGEGTGEGKGEGKEERVMEGGWGRRGQGRGVAGGGGGRGEKGRRGRRGGRGWGKGRRREK